MGLVMGYGFGYGFCYVLLSLLWVLLITRQRLHAVACPVPEKRGEQQMGHASDELILGLGFPNREPRKSEGSFHLPELGNMKVGICAPLSRSR